MANHDEFSEFVLKETASIKQCTGPYGFYNIDGDQIEFTIRPTNFYARFIDNYLTFYYERTADEVVVGFAIAGIRSIIGKPGMREFIVVRNNQLRVSDFVLMHFMWRQKMVEVAIARDGNARWDSDCVIPFEKQVEIILQLIAKADPVINMDGVIGG